MMLCNKPLAILRVGLVLVTGCVVTWNYYAFSHFVHHQHFGNFTRGNHTSHGFHPSNQTTHGSNHTHGGNPFEGVYRKKDSLFLYGLALPLTLLAVASLIWNPTTTATAPTQSPRPAKKNFLDSVRAVRHSRGDVNVHKWTIIWFILPLLFVLFDSANEHFAGGRAQEKAQMDWSWFNSVLTSFMSPTGYAAVWALAAFLVPVTKHSPILDWLHITPAQALAFHRVAGWTSLVFSCLHGFLHLRHLMDVLRRGNPRPWYSELAILLIPPSWECIGTQTPFQVFFSEPRQTPIHMEDSRCWLALVNATGMISVLAFLVLAITSLPIVRRSSYDLFYRVHIPMAWIMMVTAIWHYPTCALVLIPNILYYISFNLPVHVSQSMDYYWSRRHGEKPTSPLVEANLIQGGVVELVFATEPTDRQRHESRFVQVSHPLVSSVSHPFSVFSSQDLRDEYSAPVMRHHNDTLSILLRNTGPFVEGLTKELFPNGSDGVSSSSTQDMLQFDSYYASSFDWVDRAMLSHDEILLVAGGVGIVPFLEFLPALQQAIVQGTNACNTSLANQQDATEENTHDHLALMGLDDEALLMESSSSTVDTTTTGSVGPKRVHLHWYVREVGLASYVWHKHLQHHVQRAWEGNSSCKGRLTVHLHLTSLNPTEGPRGCDSCRSFEETLARIPNTGLAEKRVYYSSEDEGSTIRPVRDAPTAQSWLVGLVVPGFVMIAATHLHWWWYRGFIVNDKFREDNLVIRSHSIIFTILLALVVSILAHGYLRWRDDRCRRANYAGVPENDATTECPPDHTTLTVNNNNKVCDTPTKPTISAGRPNPDTVVRDVLKAHRPGVYMCGPSRLMDSVEGAVRDERSGCAFYRNDSEM